MHTNSQFFQKLNYASFHEDSRSERRALELRSSDRVLCLTGSGARPLDLLLDDPAEIVAIDWNPAQSHLLELKLSAIRNLDYDQGLQFLGFRASTERESMYAALVSDLSPDARAFWDDRSDSIRRGVFFDGGWERFLRRVSWLARKTRRDWVRQLFDSPDVASQHAFWCDHWDNRAWRVFVRLVTNRILVRYVLREPGLNLVPPELSISDYIQERFKQASGSFLFRDSPWIWALFNGRIDTSGPLPEHLKPENFSRIRERCDSIRVVTASLKDYLASGQSKFEAFSLSDFASYCDQPAFEEIWCDLLKRSARGARYCERRFLVNYDLPPSVQSAVTIDETLARQLDQDDLSVVYTFLVARLAES